jgi:putative ABC transport system substrate-binding protein
MRRRDFIKVGAGVAACAVSLPLAARAQQRQMPVLGFLSSRSAGDSISVEAAFRKGLGEAGYVDGRNVRIVHRWAEGRNERLPALAAELVAQRVSAIAAVGGDIAVQAAKASTATIPIVMLTGTDPAKTGLVASLNRPGGNVTGVTLYSAEVEQKRLELLRELVPAADLIAVLSNPKGPNYRAKKAEIESAAQTLGQKIAILDASTEPEIESAFSSLLQTKAGGLLVGTDPFFSTRRNQIMALAMRHGVPAIYDSRLQVEAGGLASYGTSYTETYRQAGIYAGRVLKGTRPADLPVLLPTRFELVINLTTAKALGLALPATLLARADEVVE